MGSADPVSYSVLGPQGLRPQVQIRQVPPASRDVFDSRLLRHALDLSAVAYAVSASAGILGVLPADPISPCSLRIRAALSSIGHSVLQ